MSTQKVSTNGTTMQHEEDVAIIIRKARMNFGFSQSESAEMLDICQQQFNKYETGQHEPSARLLIRIMRLFKLTIEDFYPPPPTR